jgi:hypothetical protein
MAAALAATGAVLLLLARRVSGRPRPAPGEPAYPS